MKRRLRVSAGWRERLAIFLLFTLALITVELVHDVYRIFAYAEEREQLRELNAEVTEAGVEYLRTQLRADSLRLRYDQLNILLDDARDTLDAYDRRAARGRLGSAEYSEYRQRVGAHNRRVEELNALANEFQEALVRNRHAVRRYNELAEQIRALAALMGEAHYNIPSPAEAAVRQGMRPQ